jgi:GNAT superfamily N-acetyltransferase
MTASRLTVVEHNQTKDISLVRELKAVYKEAYAEPPYDYDDDDADEFVDRYNAQAERPGFRLLLATDNVGVAAFAYGFTFPTDQWWRGGLGPAPARAEAASRYAVIELVVARRARGLGLSRELMQRLLADRAEEIAILLAKPGSQAHAMYLRWGWRIVGQVQSYPTWPVDDAFLLELHPRSPDPEETPA